MLLLLACVGKIPLAPADTDPAVDADPDTDADTDTQPDTGPFGDTNLPRGFQGEVTLVSSYAGQTLCDISATLSGTRYLRACPGCTFAFDIAAAVIRDDSPAACVDVLDWLTFVEDGETALMMGWTPDLVGGYRGYYHYYDVFFSGDALEYGWDVGDGNNYEGRWPIAFSHGGESWADRVGEFSQDGDAIRWEVHQTVASQIDHGWVNAAVDIVGTGTITP